MMFHHTITARMYFFHMRLFVFFLIWLIQTPRGSRYHIIIILILRQVLVQVPPKIRGSMFNVVASDKTTSTTHKQTEKYAGREVNDLN